MHVLAYLTNTIPSCYKHNSVFIYESLDCVLNLLHTIKNKFYEQTFPIPIKTSNSLLLLWMHAFTMLYLMGRHCARLPVLHVLPN